MVHLHTYSRQTDLKHYAAIKKNETSMWNALQDTLLKYQNQCCIKYNLLVV